MRKLLPIILSSFFLSPFLSFSQAPTYYADTVQIALYERPVAIEFVSEDSLYYYDPISNIAGNPFYYRADYDSIIIYKDNTQFKGVFSRNKDTLEITFLGERLQLIRTFKPSFIERPQKPEHPFPYKQKEVKFRSSSGDTIMLTGILTLPRLMTESTPVVVMVSGSGPQDRNSTIMNHSPFLVITDYLARHGIASLRYDDRGVGESEGVFQKATIGSFVNDAMGAIRYLRKLNIFSEIGLLGHSEGGMVASAVCTMADGADFYILLAAPAVPIDTLLYDQSMRLMKSAGSDSSYIAATLRFNARVYNLAEKSIPMDSLPSYLDPIIQDYLHSLDSTTRAEYHLGKNSLYFKVAGGFYGDYLHSFLTFPSGKYFTQMTVPTLAIYGGSDVQVSAELNMPALKKQLKEAPVQDYRVVLIPHLNHLMQYSETGSPSEYVYIPTTVEPEVLELIVDWIEGYAIH